MLVFVLRTVSNIGANYLLSTRNSKGLKNESVVSSNSSRISSTFSARSEAALIAEKSTLERRQAIQMDEYRLESEIQKSRMEQDRARLEL